MSKFTKSIAAAVIALATAGLAYSPSASAAASVPLTLTQQGRLLDSTGAAVDGVQLTFTFSLYTAAAAGTAIWTENQSITPDKGYFSAKLGDVTAFPANIFDGSQPQLYLGIKIGTDAEMAPRQALTSVPFALLAANALNATHAANADLAANATNATNATLAANATHAVNADNATKAVTAATVTSIAGNLTFINSSSAADHVVGQCPAGYTKPTGGGCTAVSGTISSSAYEQGKDNLPTGWACQCTGTNCSVIAQIECAN